MIFPNLELEDIVQVGDKTRLNAGETFATPDEADISLIEIDPGTGSFFNVTEKRYLDYAYATDGVMTVTVRVTTDGLPVTVSQSITIISEADDKLFSTDAQLVPREPKILRWVAEGRNSFKDVHREAQRRILSHFDENGKWDEDGERLTKDDVTDITEFSEWSKFLTLQLIFEGRSNATDDIFHEKAERYRIKAEFARDRKKFRIDRTNDGNTTEEEDNFESRSVRILRT